MKDWLLLKTLYEQQNMTKTAEVLYVSQPSLSYRIQQLEKEFGITIMHRGRRGVEFKVTSSRNSELTNSVYKQDVHIGFIRGDYNWPEEKHLIMTENIWIVSKREISLHELPGLPRIMYKTDISLENLFDNWWKETFSKPPSITMEVDHMERCKEMVLSGFGYAIIPQIVLTGSEDFYRIQLRTKHGEPILRKSWMIYQKESMQISLLKAFVDFIKERKLM
ncbi:LysR family transcriptional regulator [Brevibacillus brevis]|uniref:LysR family transcriptional regulator n=1 Tax=Brevibacillus brevis TaxID=1393 RepID=UPI0022AAFC03|nr:LysR family transcriptional regulator [Brevibacillus brevis]